MAQTIGISAGDQPVWHRIFQGYGASPGHDPEIVERILRRVPQRERLKVQRDPAGIQASQQQQVVDQQRQPIRMLVDNL